MRDDCVSSVKKLVTANTPIKLHVESMAGDTKIQFGEPYIYSYSRPCFFRRNDLEFIVEQKICVEIPIKYRVDVDAGQTYADCNT